MANRFSDIIGEFESGVQKRGDRVTLWNKEKDMVPHYFLFNYDKKI